MKEYIDIRQLPGEWKRRWFFSGDFDLIIWFSDEGYFRGFELRYDKHGHERSIRWTSSGRFHHRTVDDGKQNPGRYKETHVLVLNGFFDARQIHSAFSEVSHSLPAEVAEYVLNKLGQYPKGIAELAE
jgi:hypothetical protein